MRLSELLGVEVVDQDGNVLGEVHDVRLREDEPGAGRDGRFVIGALVLGVGSLGGRLGYAHGAVEGPWVLARRLRRLSRHARCVPWQHVASFAANRLVATAAAEDLVHAIPPRRSGR